MALKPGWPNPDETDGLCPGGCGKLHRTCCDSVLGEPHQTRCRLVNAMPDRPWWSRLVAALRRAA